MMTAIGIYSQLINQSCIFSGPSVIIKTSTFYSMNNSVKNQVTWIIFGTQNVEEILRKWYVACPPQLNDVTIVYLVKGRPYASEQIFIAFFKNWMHLK